jgi:multiple antibiotic resistance protein
LISSPLYVFVTLLVMINPVEAAAAFATMTAGDSEAAKASIALRATIVAGIILLAFGFIGDALLSALGIGFPAFRIAGGLLLLRVGFNMVFADRASAGNAPGGAAADPAVFPLAIPIITGPGALTAIVTLMTRTHEAPVRVVVLVLTAVIIMVLTYLTMRSSMTLTRYLGSTGVDAVGRVMGVIVAAIAVQLIVDGVTELVHAAG